MSFILSCYFICGIFLVISIGSRESELSKWTGRYITRAFIHKANGRLTARTRDVSKRPISVLDFFQRCHRGGCQISERCDHYSIKFRGFRTSQDLAVRRLIAKWIEAQSTYKYNYQHTLIYCDLLPISHMFDAFISCRTNRCSFLTFRAYSNLQTDLWKLDDILLFYVVVNWNVLHCWYNFKYSLECSTLFYVCRKWVSTLIGLYILPYFT